MKVLYCGDGPVEGAARYLTGILRAMRADVTHLLPKTRLDPTLLRKKFNVILLSDFPSASAPRESQRRIVGACASGTGLAMIGGWASFTGLDGLWRGSIVEEALPVESLAHDDRHNIAGGLLVTKLRAHPILRGVSFRTSPIICGLNEVVAKPGARVILEARPIKTTIGRAGRIDLELAARRFPLLATGQFHRGRTAAFATDLAPHWCGGLVDWGPSSRALPVKAGVEIEVGSCYITFVTNLVRWLVGPQ